MQDDIIRKEDFNTDKQQQNQMFPHRYFGVVTI
jgi:hypothetical protein